MNEKQKTKMQNRVKEIEVIFYTSLDYYKTISENNFRIECDFSQVTDENSKLIPKIKKQPLFTNQVGKDKLVVYFNK